MSADNWTTCPKCKARREKEYAELVQKAGTSYGVVSPEEYQKMAQQVSMGIIKTSELGEYYEIGIRDGKLAISYFAECEECGFTFTFEHTMEV